MIKIRAARFPVRTEAAPQLEDGRMVGTGTLLQMQPQLYLHLSENAFKTRSPGKLLVEKTPLKVNFLFMQHFDLYPHLPREFLDIPQSHAWLLMWPEFGERSATPRRACFLLLFKKMNVSLVENPRITL